MHGAQGSAGRDTAVKPAGPYPRRLAPTAPGRASRRAPPAMRPRIVLAIAPAGWHFPPALAPKAPFQPRQPTTGCRRSSGVERTLGKGEAAGSNPAGGTSFVSRSIDSRQSDFGAPIALAPQDGR